MNWTSFGDEDDWSVGDEHVFPMVLANDTNSFSSGTLEDILKGHNNGSGWENAVAGPSNDLNWWALLTFIVPLLAVFGNLLVILAVRNEPRLQTRTNSFLLSLAVCDSLVALLVIPPSCLQLITGMYHHPSLYIQYTRPLSPISPHHYDQTNHHTRNSFSINCTYS